MADMAKDLELKLKITADGKVAASELNQVGDGVDRLGSEAKKAAGDTDLLTTGLKGVAAALTVDFLLGQAAELGALADEYNNMAGRLKLVAGEGAGLAEALWNVRATANAAGAEIGATADLYATLARATKGSATEIDGLTSTIVKSFAVSGAGAAAAEGATRQLGQALASGVLRGDEFNSVMEQAPRLAQAMADGLGVTTGELRKMAAEGKLTSDVVIGALKSQADAIESDFATLPDTIGRATQRLTNEWTVFIGELDKTSGASAAVSSAIGGVANNLDEIASLATVAGEAVFAAFVTRAGAGLLTYGRQLIAVRTATAATAAASIASGNAANWATLQAEKLAAAELARAKAVQSATAATLAELTATSAAAQQAAIYGPQRAALEREVAAARAANATATRALVAAEGQLLAAQKAGGAAAGALTAQTVANAGVMATAWGKVQGAARGVMNTIRSIPTTWLVAIAVVGWEAGVAGVKKVSEALAEMALKADGTRKRLDDQRQAMFEQAGAASSAAQALSEYKDVTVQVVASVVRMGDAERERYASSLKQSQAYWEAIYREQAALESVGKGSKQAKEEAQKHLQEIGAGIRDLESAAALTREALANLMAPEAAVLVKDFTEQVVALEEKGEPAARAVQKALSDMTKGLDTDSVVSIRAFGQALEELLTQGVISAQQVSEAWSNAIGKMGGEELQKFAISAQAAFGDSERDAKALAETMDKVLRQAIANTGQDFDLITRGVSKAANAAILNFDLIKDSLKDLAAKGADTGKLLAGGIAAGFKSADSLAAIKYWDDQIKQLGASGQLSAEQIKTATGESNAAFVKYAETAIAANGGIADSTVKAEAAQRGFTVAVDETGKAAIRTQAEMAKLEKIADAARSAAQAAAAANTKAMESAAIAASQARTSIGSTQDSIDGFIEHLHGLGNAMAGFLNNARQEIFNVTNGSEEAQRALSETFKYTTYSFNQYFEHVWRGMAAIKQQYAEQKSQVESYIEVLNSGTANSRTLIDAANVLNRQFDVLGEKDLAPLREAIADAERRMLDLRDAAQSTLDSIQDEWDQLNNNLDEIERRRAEKREAEIKAQLAAAQASGDREAIADLQKSLQLLKDITAARIADAKQREKDANTKTSSTATSSTTSSSGSIGGGATRSSASAGNTYNIYSLGTPKEMAHLLKPEIDKLGRLGG